MNNSIFKGRRKQLVKGLKDSILIIPSSGYKNKSHDTEYSFRQDSNFYYLTGFNEPQSVLILSNKGNKLKSILFVRDKDPFMEMWSGRRAGPKKAKKDVGVDEVFTIDRLHHELGNILEGHENLYLDFFHHTALFEEAKKAVKSLTLKKKQKLTIPLNWSHLTPLIGEMRLVKDKYEIGLMKKAQAVTNKAHRAAMAMAKPGVNEKEVDSLLSFFFSREANAQAYENIVACGDNANILHYVENNMKMKDGDLLLIDAGCQLDYYASDVTRTFPVNGKFSEEQKEVYEIVLKAQKKAIAAVKVGVTLNKIHEIASKELIKGLIKLKILKGSVSSIYKSGKHRTYYPHGTGHWLGLDVHDNSPYLDKKLEEIKFKPGMVITVEPGLYFPKDEKSVPKKYRGIGIRIEDDILVTRSGYDNLSKDIPKEIKEVEKACQKDYRSFL